MLHLYKPGALRGRDESRPYRSESGIDIVIARSNGIT
jgi:hypothetical protein